MIQMLFPNERYASAYDIPYEKLYEAGYRAIIFDIDNTLVEHGAPANDRSVALFERLHAIGFRTCLISNNKAPRVLPFARAVKSPAVWNAHKPSPKKYLRAMRKLRVSPQTTFFVGDQILTDVLGANLAGLASILTEPISPKEEIQIVWKRYLEKVILRFYGLCKKEALVKKGKFL